MSFLPILLFFGILFFISPSYYVYKISHGQMNSSDFPLFYLIMILTLSLWWLVIGIKEDRIQGNHFVIGLLGTVFLNIWIVNYNLAARESKILLFIIFMILFIYEIFIFYISCLTIFDENQNKLYFNILNFIIIVLTFSSPLFSVFCTNRQKHKQIPLLCNLTGFALNIVWIGKEILENLPSLININWWDILSFGSGAFLTFFQFILYNILKKKDLKKIKKHKKDVEEELISKEEDDINDIEKENKNIKVEDKN